MKRQPAAAGAQLRFACALGGRRFCRGIERACRLGIAVAALLGCQGPDPQPGSPATTLTVSAAASLQDAMHEIAREFERGNPGVAVRLNLGSSGTLQQQIERGAPVDVFLSAGDAQVDALQAAGLVDSATRKAFASNELVLISPAGAAVAMDDFGDLARPSVQRVALGAPASVPAGRYGVEVLRALGIEQAVMAKAVLGQHVRQVLAYVESGEVDAGIVYRTDAAGRSRVRVVATAPPGSHPPIAYLAAVPTASEHPDEARRFAAYLTSPAASGILRRFGFDPPPPASTARPTLQP